MQKKIIVGCTLEYWNIWINTHHLIIIYLLYFSYLSPICFDSTGIYFVLYVSIFTLIILTQSNQINTFFTRKECYFRINFPSFQYSWTADSLFLHWKKKWSHFDLKSWVTGGTKIRPCVLQLLGIPGRILVQPVTQLFRSKWLISFSVLLGKSLMRTDRRELNWKEGNGLWIWLEKSLHKHQRLIFLCHWFYCVYCFIVFIVLLCLLFYCVYCSIVFIVPYFVQY